MKNTYLKLLKQYESKGKKLSFAFNVFALLRLAAIVLFLVSLWLSITDYSLFVLLTACVMLIAFLLLMKRQDIIRYQLHLTRALAAINKNEISFLESGKSSYYSGKDFSPAKHTNANDLDLFGEASVYQHLNRTSTVMGQRSLAEMLLGKTKSNDIVSVQQAVRELAPETEFRQQLQAVGTLAGDSTSDLAAIQQWCENEPASMSLMSRLLSFAAPVALIGLIITSFISNFWWIQYAASMMFIFNLSMLGIQIKKLKSELSGADKIDAILKNYSRMAMILEEKKFNAPLLQNLQKIPGNGISNISHQLAKLSGFFRNLETISNVLAAFFLNGLFQYHIHTLHKLLVWKRKHAQHLPEWLDCIGEAEALNSLANFAANNPDYAFPEISQEPVFTFRNLGHPLIMSNKRICNDVDFDGKRFIVLTGSNMSGKSTFLRTVGVNLVLARMGAPVCATDAVVYPVDVLTSIQQSDSLNENESYFFAEVKRLKSIMDAASEKTVFVLLDEILRGTNSDDKRSGTMEVIRKLAAIGCFGIIATHDLEICNMEPDYPGVLSNMCFEAEIRNDELHFDYQLRSGVCRNKSATFLMKKMGVV